MGLLTPEYMELQKRLHKEADYGKGVDAEECARIIRNIAPAGASVLDYGCGQGHLKRWLEGYDTREYDPCIEGRDSRPEPADYVVCADVLEHIEPGCLDTVIGHLRECTRKRLVVVIATRPSGKFLADGRNAHLIVEGEDFWREKLKVLFRIERLENRHDEGKGIFGVLEPSNVLQELKSIGVMTDDERNAHVAQNIGRTWRRIPQAPMTAHGRAAILCCYGPSLDATYKAAEAQRVELAGSKLITVSGAHDFLRKKGIKPDFHVECDPRAHKAGMVRRTIKSTSYLMASCCHPDFIKRLADDEAELILWHQFNGEKSYEIRNHPSEKTQALIPGGGSVALRTMVLFYFLGYRNFIVHGFDCSFANGREHAGPHTGKKLAKEFRIRVDGTDHWFDTAPVFVSYAQTMMNDIRDGRFPESKFYFMGDGLFQTMLRKYVNSPQVPAGPDFGRDYFSLRPADVRKEETWSEPKEDAA